MNTLIDRVEGLANRGGVRRDFLLQIGILSAKGLSKNVFQLKSIRPHPALAAPKTLFIKIFI